MKQRNLRREGRSMELTFWQTMAACVSVVLAAHVLGYAVYRVALWFILDD